MSEHMRCPHCSGGSVPEPRRLLGASNMCAGDEYCEVWCGTCKNPECRRLVIWLQGQGGSPERRIIPREPGTGLDGVPQNVDEAYAQARALLDHSPPVSASISRELLQGVLREHFEGRGQSLHDDMAGAAKSGGVSAGLAGKLDRLASGLASHPVHDRNPLMVVDVGRDEAELTLESLHGLLRHHFAGRGA